MSVFQRFMACMHAQPPEDGTMQCAWVPLCVLLASLGLKAVPGEAMPHRVQLMEAPGRRLLASWDTGRGQGEPA